MRWYLIVVALVALYLACTWYGDTFDPDAVSGKRVLITGASQGIGEKIAIHYAKFGANVVITARNTDRLQKVLERCRAVGHKDRTYHYISADMEDTSTPEAVIVEATRVLGGLDVIVLNHVAFGDFNLWTGSDVNFAEFDVAMTVNVRSYVHLASLALPHLEKTDGAVAVLSSICARMPVPRLGAYSTSKGAIDSFFTYWSFELKQQKYNISVSLATLGLTGTENAHTLMQHVIGFDSESFRYASPDTAALAVIKGTTLRQDRIFYPPSARLFSWVYDLMPNLYSSLITFAYGEFNLSPSKISN